ncbi:MAG: RNA methyltransferase [Bacilli bacterium]|nr:RNA methyltransferase [Bacilli bacterium]
MIESVNNEKIKYYAKLNKKKYRDETGLFIVEGEHLVEEAKKRDLVEVIYSLDSRDGAIQVSSSVMAKLSGLNTIPRILAVVKIPKERKIKGNILLLDDIQDPGNLGTIIRSAVAFGVSTIVASNNTVDFYNLKTIRSSEGMIFNINLIKDDLENFITQIRDKYIIYTTNVVNGKSVDEVKINEPYCLIMGNEGSGVRESIQKLANESLYIPMDNRCESLNVAMATSIILYEFSKRK